MGKATIPKPIIMEFELDTGKNFKEVRHFNLIKGKDLFSEKLNISINRGFSKAKYTYSVKIRQEKKWSEQITGLFPTHDPDVFYGDIKNRSHLLIVRFMASGSKLRFFYFPNFYTRHLADFLKTFKEYY